MDPGDLLCVYSDGLTEAVDGADEEYGLDRLSQEIGQRRDVAGAADLRRGSRERRGLRARNAAVRRPDPPPRPADVRRRALSGLRSRGCCFSCGLSRSWRPCPHRPLRPTCGSRAPPSTRAPRRLRGSRRSSRAPARSSSSEIPAARGSSRRRRRSSSFRAPSFSRAGPTPTGISRGSGRRSRPPTCEARRTHRKRRAGSARWPRSFPGGAWAEGRGWDQNRWPGSGYPDARDLDKAVPDRPAVARRVDGHAVWVNTAALSAARIAAETRDPEGGRILRRADGSPSGVFVDNAMRLVTGAMPAASQADFERWIVGATAACARSG